MSKSLIKKISVLICVLACFGPGPFAEDAPFSMGFSINEHEHLVIEFFSFFCSHCRDTDPQLVHWGKTLPEPMRFLSVPVMNASSVSSIQLARAYYTVSYLDPAKLPAFKERLYALAQGGGRNLDKDETYFELAATFEIRAFHEYWNSQALKTALLEASHMSQAYRVSNVPALAIGGRSLITPGSANGDYRMFIQLANGLVSQILAGGIKGE